MNKPPKVNKICHQCALKKGAEWGKKCYDTFHISICEICKKETATCHPKEYVFKKDEYCI